MHPGVLLLDVVLEVKGLDLRVSVAKVALQVTGEADVNEVTTRNLLDI